MADVVNLKDSVELRGPYAVWELMDEDDQREAARALWENADRTSRAAVELILAKELKFRPQSVRTLPFEKVATRLLRAADSLPETVLFQFLFHLHLVGRKEMLSQFLDAIELPHTDGVLELPDDAEAPDAAKVKPAAKDLIKAHDRKALVYLATLKVADGEFWGGVDPILTEYAEDGEKIKKTKKKKAE